MPRESKESKASRVKKMLSAFERTYPNAHCELNFSNPLELLIATILSAQCTDKRVNMVTQQLFKKYRSAADYAQADPAIFEREIQSTGFFRNKARSIRACCRALVEKHMGEVPATMDQLVSLDGVGRKTANVVLGNAFQKNFGVVVDTHVGRLAGRLGLTRNTAPEKVELDLMQLIPQEQWAIFSHWLIWHGRRRCYARNPDCANCEVLSLCPRIGVAARKPVASNRAEDPKSA